MIPMDLILQTIHEMHSAVTLSKEFGTPVADHELIQAWAAQLARGLAGAPVPIAMISTDQETVIALRVAPTPEAIQDILLAFEQLPEFIGVPWFVIPPGLIVSVDDVVLMLRRAVGSA